MEAEWERKKAGFQLPECIEPDLGLFLPCSRGQFRDQLLMPICSARSQEATWGLGRNTRSTRHAEGG